MSSLAAAPTVTSAARTIIYLGMDVHKDSITIAVLPQDAKAPTHVERLANELPKLMQTTKLRRACLQHPQHPARTGASSAT